MTYPRIRLAHCPGTPADNVLLGQRGRSKLPPESWPSLLMSYHYLREGMDFLPDLACTEWVLDSGAFSALNSGATIDPDTYIQFCKDVLSGPRPPVEIFALDVIGDHDATLANTEAAWEAGIECIPTYHPGEPESYLRHIAETYPKIAIGGVAMMKPTSRKLAFAKAVFARVWPKPIHGLGFGTEQTIMALPWHTVDASNWQAAPSRFGNWRSYSSHGSRRVSLRGSTHDLTPEVDWHLRMERRAQQKWASRMLELEALTT